MTYNIYYTRTDASGWQDTFRVATMDDRETAWDVWAALLRLAKPGEVYELREEEDTGA